LSVLDSFMPRARLEPFETCSFGRGASVTVGFPRSTGDVNTATAPLRKSGTSEQTGNCQKWAGAGDPVADSFRTWSQMAVNPPDPIGPVIDRLTAIIADAEARASRTGYFRTARASAPRP
ncbi:MAG TPA: hypothetical protein VN923_02605, partial [Thermoanaerobaculia bacterium]|nr:hypothetical protein [Thermoanaerobaculia bacterium]